MAAGSREAAALRGELAAARQQAESAEAAAEELRAQREAAAAEAAALKEVLEAARQADRDSSVTIGELQMAAAMQGETLQQLQVRRVSSLSAGPAVWPI